MAKNGAPSKPKHKDLLLRAMPADLLGRVRSSAALQDRPTKEVVIEALEDYLKKRGA